MSGKTKKVISFVYQYHNMVKEPINKISAIVLCFIMSSVIPAFGVYDESGEWVCLDITVEMKYYEFYTNEFQLMIDEVNKNEGPEAAKIFFEESITNEGMGQDWKKSRDCLVSLDADEALLSEIVISDLDSVDSIEDIFIEPKKTIPDLSPLDTPNDIEPGREYESDNLDIIGIVGVIIIGIVGVFAYMRFMKSNAKKRHTKQEKSPKIEIDITGGVEK